MLLLTALLAPAFAQAPDPAPAGPGVDTTPTAPAPAPTGLTPPRLRAPVPTTWPADAPADATSAQVALELDIDAAGAVRASRVAISGGPAFDAAALALAPTLAFDPARDARGEPVPVTLTFRVDFTRTVVRVPVRALEGRVRDADGIDVAGAEVRLTGPGGAAVAVRAGADGAFALDDLAPGDWLVAVVAPGFTTETATATVAAGKVASLAFTLTPGAAFQSDDVIEIVQERTPPEVTERVVSVDEIRYLPGTNGDVIKVVQNLPGVARPPLGIGQLIIRGTAPEDSQYFLDGGSIPIVFHFGGLSTVVNSDLLAEVAFLPGNFGVRYGRVLGGLVDIRTDDTLPEKTNGNLAVDVYQSTAFFEAKVGRNTALTFSARRSYVDVFLDPILASMGNGATIRTPRYWDAQVRVLHKAGALGTFDALYLASDDGFAFSGANDGDGLSFGTSFQKLRLRWERDLPSGWSSETVLTAGPTDNTFDVGDGGEAWERPILGNLRQEFVHQAGPGERVGWRLGADLLGGVDRYLYDVTRFGTKREEGDTPLLAPALYVEPTVTLGDFTVIPGLRADGLILEDLAKLAVDPRLVVKHDTAPGTLLKASVGRYSQWPTTRELTPAGDGNAELTAPWSLQSSVGVEQQLPFDVSFEGTAFYNVLSDLVVGREDRFAFFTGPPPNGPFDTEGYANAGSGMVCGIEGLFKYSDDRTTALLAVTGSHSERTTRSGEERLFRYDQPWVVNALASRELPRKWRLGARVRYTSGNPYTKVVNRIYDTDGRRFFPVYGDSDAARLPAFWSVDLRVDKDYVFRKWTLTAYLDLQNALFAKNIEVMSWAYDYSEETPITGNPPLPAFGLKGSF